MAIRPEDIQQGRIVTSFVVEAPPERVFKAFTDAKDLRMWLAENYDVDARVGGKFRFGGPETGGPRSGEFLKVESPRLLVFSWKWNELDENTGEEMPHWSDDAPTRVQVKFEPEGKGTRVELVHDTFQVVDSDFFGYSLGWEMLAAKGMKYYLENGGPAYEAWWEKKGPALHGQFQAEMEKLLAQAAANAA